MVGELNVDESERFVRTILHDSPLKQVFREASAVKAQESMVLYGNNNVFGGVITDSLLSEARNRCKRRSGNLELNIPEVLSEKEKTVLEKGFPNFNIKFSDTVLHGHAVAKAARRCQYEEIYVNKIGISTSPVPAGYDDLACDVGGNVAIHYARNWTGVHSCNPVMDFTDANRRAYMNYRRANDSGLNEFLTRRPFLSCERRAQECDRMALYVSFVHSAYDIECVDIANILERKGAIAGFGYVHYSPEILYRLRGVIADIGMHWETDLENDTIRFTFADNSFDYVHSYSKYMAFVRSSSIRSSSGSVYSVNWRDCSLGSVYFEIFPIGREVSGVVYRTIPFPAEFDNYVVCGYYAFDTNVRNENWIFSMSVEALETKSLTKRYIVLPKIFVDAVFNHAMACVEGSLNLRNIFNFARARASTVIIDGSVKLRPYEQLGVCEVIAATLCAYQFAYTQRFCMSKAAKLFGSREERRRGALLDSRVMRWIRRKRDTASDIPVAGFWKNFLKENGGVVTEFCRPMVTLSEFVNTRAEALRELELGFVNERSASIRTVGLGDHSFRLVDVPGDGFCAVHSLNCLLGLSNDEDYYKHLLKRNAPSSVIRKNLDLRGDNPESWLYNDQVEWLLGFFGKRVYYTQDLVNYVESGPLLGEPVMLYLADSHMSPGYYLDPDSPEVICEKFSIVREFSEENRGEIARCKVRSIVSELDFDGRKYSKVFVGRSLRCFRKEVSRLNYGQGFMFVMPSVRRLCHKSLKELAGIVNNFRKVRFRRTGDRFPYYVVSCYGLCERAVGDYDGQLFVRVESVFAKEFNRIHDRRYLCCVRNGSHRRESLSDCPDFARNVEVKFADSPVVADGSSDDTEGDFFSAEGGVDPILPPAVSASAAAPVEEVEEIYAVVEKKGKGPVGPVDADTISVLSCDEGPEVEVVFADVHVGDSEVSEYESCVERGDSSPGGGPVSGVSLVGYRLVDRVGEGLVAVNSLAVNQHFAYDPVGVYSIDAAIEWFALLVAERKICVAELRRCYTAVNFVSSDVAQVMARRFPTISLLKGRKFVVASKCNSVASPLAYDGERFCDFEALEEDKFYLVEERMANSVTNKMIEKFSEMEVRDVENGAVDIRMVRGVFGCGKTTYILQSVVPGDAILCSTTKGAEEVRSRLASRSVSLAQFVEVRTIDSVLINGFSVKPAAVYIDEAFMNHCGKLCVLMNLPGVDVVYLIGDDLQLPAYVRTAPAVRSVRYTGVFPHRESFRVLDVNYRNPSDVCTLFAERYASVGINITSRSGRNRRSMYCNKLLGIAEINRGLLRKNGAVLTFTQNEKKQILMKFPGSESKVFTIHEYQGSEADRVVLIRLVSVEADPIYSSDAHILVALTRHKKHFMYLSPVKDKTWNLILSLVRSAGFYPEIGRPNLHVYYEESAVVSRGLKQRFVDEGDLFVINVMKGLDYQCLLGPHVWDAEGPIPECRVDYVVCHQSLRNRDVNRNLVITGSRGVFDSSRDRRDFGYDYDSFIYSSRHSRVMHVRGNRGLVSYLPVVRELLAVEFASFAHDSSDFYSSYVGRMGIEDSVNYRMYESRLETSVEEDCLEVLRAEPEEITHILDYIRPGTVYVDNMYDNVFQLLENREYVSNSGRLDFSSETVPDVLEPFYHPRVASSLMRPVAMNVDNFLRALEKRNLNVVFQNEIVDVGRLLAFVDCRFDELYFDSDRLRVATSDPIRFSRASFMEWLRTQDPNILSAIGVEGHVSELDFSTYDLMLKSAVKPDLTLDAARRIGRPQVIAAHSKILNSYFCPVVRIFTERVIASLRNNVLLNTGLTVEELCARMGTVAPPSLDYYSLECDMSKFDKSQGMLALEIECWFLGKFGFDAEYVQLWRNAHEVTRLRNRELGITQDIVYQRKSGDAMTYIGNTLITMATLALCIDPGFEFAMFSGDDSLVLSRLPFDVGGYHDIIARVMNFEVKIFDFASMYFCSKFLIPLEGRWVLVPDPLKFLVKLGRSDLVSEEHVEEYRISSYDLVKNCFNYEVLLNLGGVFSDRYGVAVDMVYVFSVLKFFLSEPGRFLGLYRRNPDRVFRGIDLPKLEI